jgi:hypothetical protein
MRGRVSFSIPYSQYAAIPRGARLWPSANPLDLEIALAMAAPLEAPETRLHALFAVLGTDLGTAPYPSFGTPCRRENGVGSPADVDEFLGRVNPWNSFGAGARPCRVTNCCFEHAGQNFGFLDRGPRAIHPM